MASRLVRPHVVAISGPGIVGEQVSVRQIDSVLQRLVTLQCAGYVGDTCRFSGNVITKWSRGGMTTPRLDVDKNIKQSDFFTPLRAAAGIPSDYVGQVTYHLLDGLFMSATCSGQKSIKFTAKIR